MKCVSVYVSGFVSACVVEYCRLWDDYARARVCVGDNVFVCVCVCVCVRVCIRM